MTPTEVFDDFRSSFRSRKFTAGLLLAFIDFLVELSVPDLGLLSFEGFLVRFKRQTMTAAGKRANTLIVDRGGGQTLSIRPFYNRAELYFVPSKSDLTIPAALLMQHRPGQTTFLGWTRSSPFGRRIYPR